MNQLLRPSGLSAATWPGPVEKAMKVSLPEILRLREAGFQRVFLRDRITAAGIQNDDVLAWRAYS